MTTKEFTATVDVDLTEWDDDEIREEFKRRGLSVDFSGVDNEDLQRWAELLRAGKDDQVLAEFRVQLRDYLGLAML